MRHSSHVPFGRVEIELRPAVDGPPVAAVTIDGHCIHRVQDVSWTLGTADTLPSVTITFDAIHLRVGPAKPPADAPTEVGESLNGGRLRPTRPPADQIETVSVLELQSEERRLRQNADAIAAAIATKQRRQSDEEKLKRAGKIYDTLVFARTERCRCGAGMAYTAVPPCDEVEQERGRLWDCSAVLMGIADRTKTHQGEVPHADRPIESEALDAGGKPYSLGWVTTTRSLRPVALQV